MGNFFPVYCIAYVCISMGVMWGVRWGVEWGGEWGGVGGLVGGGGVVIVMELIGPCETWKRLVKVIGLMGAEVIGGKSCRGL